MNVNRSLLCRAAAVTAAALALAACGSNSDSSTGHDGHSPESPAVSVSASQGQRNAADVAFAQGMIPHHRQAVEMAALASSRAESAEVKKLAGDIRKAQDPEIKTLAEWLTSWDEKVPTESSMNHSPHDMDGMMSSEKMDKLEKSSGQEFDAVFMEMMIKHHEGAVAMARAEREEGAYRPAKHMANTIVSSQTGEIKQMNKLLGRD